MHSLALYSQVSASRRDQVLKILAGVTAAQPTTIREQHLIYQQLQLANNPISKKGSTKQPTQNQRPLYHKLIRDIDQNGGPVQWKILIEEIPEPGAKNVISRTATETPMEELDLERFRGGSAWYKYFNQYIVIGHRFIHSNIMVKVTQIWLVPEGTGALEALDAPDPELSDCHLLDPLGTCLVEAVVRVEDGSNSKLMEQAVQELMSLQKQMDGCLELRVPDRLSLDTRVKAG